MAYDLAPSEKDASWFDLDLTWEIQPKFPTRNSAIEQCQRFTMRCNHLWFLR